MGLDEDMLICLSTLQSYCLLSVFARGVDNLFGNNNLSYINNWRVEVAKSDNSREDGDGERDGDGGEGVNVLGYANCTLQKSKKIVG